MGRRRCARRAAAVLLIQACARRFLALRRFVPSRLREQKRQRLVLKAAEIAALVTGFKTRPCLTRCHASREDALCCPFYHGDKDRRRETIVLAPRASARYHTAFERLSSAPRYKTEPCSGTACMRGRKGGFCFFYHNDYDVLPAVGAHTGFTKTTYEMHVLQALLISNGLPLVQAEPAEPVEAAEPAEPARSTTSTDAPTLSSECSICFENFDHGAHHKSALVPCGHVLCVACATRCGRCPVCDVVVHYPLKIFG